MESPPGDFKTALRARLLDGMIRKVKPPGGGWKVLVVDREALRILAAAVALDRLVDEGVTIVEMLDLRREPLPRLPAIYFITPSAESIQNFASEEKTQYKEFHLFFTSHLPDFQLDVIRSNPAVLRRVRSLVELNIHFLAAESRVFSLDRPAASLPQLFGAPYVTAKAAIEEMSLVSERLTDACNLIAPEAPWEVRFDAASTVSRTVASLVKEQLDTARIERSARQVSDSTSTSAPQSTSTSDTGVRTPSRATLIVLDRATDVVSPLMHEFSYQAMLHDLVRLDYRKPGGAHYTAKEPDANGNKKEIPIDDEEKDPVWSSVRHLFIEAAHDRAQESLRHFLNTDAAYKIVGKDNADVDISDMTAAVRSLPESQMRADRHAMHVSALRDCLNLCSSLRLTDIAAVEQDLVIGRHADGTRVHSDQMLETLSTILKAEEIPVNHRVRTLLVALAIAGADSVALGGEASLLVKSLAFRSKLAKSGISSTLPGLTTDLRASIMGLEQMLSTARVAADALAARHAPPEKEPKSTNASAAMANKLRSKLKERKAYKKHEKATATRRRRQHLDDASEVPYDVARYIPPVRSVIADLVGDELDATAFPTAGAVNADSIISALGRVHLAEEGERPAPLSLPARPLQKKFLARAADATQAVKSITRSLSRDSAELEEVPQDADPDHLYVVFFAGGVCYSEIRAVYEVCQKRSANIVVGGSQILTPEMYLSALGGVADPVLRINVLLPPLPLELAQTRAATERTRKAGAAVKKEREKPKGAVAGRSQRSAQSSSQSSTKGAGGKRVPENNSDYDRPEDAEVEVVTGVTKKGFGRFFGRKHK